MNEKVEFGSAAWIAAVHGAVAKRLATVDLSGVSFSSAEVFRNAPVHLGPDAAGCVGWWLRIVDGEVRLGDRPVDEPFDHRVVADYDVMLPVARTRYTDNPEGIAEVTKALEEAKAAGRFERQGDAPRPAQLAVLGDVHDELAAITA